MAAENHANYAKIGFSIFAAAIATILTLVYLGGLRGRKNRIYAETYYDREVSGLSVGSAVNFRGVKIGEVSEICFVANNYHVSGEDALKIRIVLAIDPKKLCYDDGDIARSSENIRMLVEKRGLRATVTASGITGLSRIECDVSATPDPVPKLNWTPKYPFVPQKHSLMANFSDAATRVMNQINSMDFAAAWSNVSVAVESLSRTAQSAQSMLEVRQADLEKMSENLSETTTSLRELSGELKNNPSLLLRERVRPTLDETR